MSTIFDLHLRMLSDYRDFVRSFLSSLMNGHGPLWTEHWRKKATSGPSLWCNSAHLMRLGRAWTS